jgi:hypothetical protein
MHSDPLTLLVTFHVLKTFLVTHLLTEFIYQNKGMFSCMMQNCCSLTQLYIESALSCHDVIIGTQTSEYAIHRAELTGCSWDMATLQLIILNIYHTMMCKGTDEQHTAPGTLMHSSHGKPHLHK